MKTSTKTIRLTHPEGLHLRPCATIVDTVRRYHADVTVRRGSQSANAGSILELLCLAAIPAPELILSAVGEETEEVLQAVAGLCAGTEADG